jgi:hypothetical protein
MVTLPRPEMSERPTSTGLGGLVRIINRKLKIEASGASRILRPVVGELYGPLALPYRPLALPPALVLVER